MSKSQQSLVFLAGKRTAFGANGGALKAVNPTELAVTSSRAALEQSGVSPDQIEHVIFGSLVPSAADALYLPRHVGLKCSVPIRVPALGINRLCGSGFQVVVEAFHQMLAGDTQAALVGGVENMSMAPYALRQARYGLKMGHSQVSDTLMESLVDSYVPAPMAITAENLAEMYKLSRETVDQFALLSQKKASAAEAAGKFSEEIVPFSLGQEMFQKDEHPRPQATLEGLMKLKPVFKKDGVVTAGNASGIVDGAASLVVSTEGFAREKGLKPFGRMVSYGISGCDPKIMGIGPVSASHKALEKAGMTLDQMDLIELNEAFAAQALAVVRELKIPEEKLNVNGGAIAIGHPLAASGARIIMTLLYELKRRKKRYGLGTACIGGGQGIALVLEAF